MFAKIDEASHVRNGMVAVQLNFFLEPNDYGYDKCLVDVPDLPEPDKQFGGYPNAIHEEGTKLEKTYEELGVTSIIDVSGQPVDSDDFQNWLASLPTKKVLKPFHIHFIYVEPETLESEIKEQAQQFLKQAYAQWSINKPITFKKQEQTRKWNDLEVAEIMPFIIDGAEKNEEMAVRVENAFKRIDDCEKKANELAGVRI